LIFLFYSIYLILGILLSITLLNAFLGPRLKAGPDEHSNPKVSVLVPARDEERHIKDCLASLQKQNYQNLEIIVLDDNSHDQTLTIAKSFSQLDPRIKVYSGKPLPEGWTGKNWACHQLSELANGDIFIFTDADNRHEANAIIKTVAWIEHFKLDLISAFPQQITKTLFEKLTVPTVDLFLYSFLPLWFTYLLPQPSLAAANGQWIAFRKKSYQQMGGHEKVKNQIVEDVELSRMAKKNKFKILTCSGSGIIYGHMYQSFKEVWLGFTKNLYGLVSHKIYIFVFIQLLLFTIFLLPYLLLFTSNWLSYSLLAIIIGLAIRIALIFGFKHPPLVSIILHPISIFMTMIIGVNSFFQITFGQISWKSRSIQLK
jgi:chlorobactene glucosyltransferase